MQASALAYLECTARELCLTVVAATCRQAIEPGHATQVLMEIAGETLEQLAGAAAPKQKQNVAQVQAAAADEEDEALRARLDAVRS